VGLRLGETNLGREIRKTEASALYQCCRGLGVVQYSYDCIIICLWLYSPCEPWPLFQFLDLLTQSVGLLGRGISPSQGRYLHTEQTYTDINASSGIRTHDPGFRAGEDGSCLGPRGHCDRHYCIPTTSNVTKEFDITTDVSIHCEI
jgi:hypothetical protein